MQYFFEIN